MEVNAEVREGKKERLSFSERPQRAEDHAQMLPAVDVGEACCCVLRVFSEFTDHLRRTYYSSSASPT